MPKRWFAALAALTFVVVAAPARAADPKAETPTLVVRLQSIDELMANANYLATLVGQEEQAKQLQGLLKSMTGDKGLQGLDTKRPIGLYGRIGSDGIDSTAVALVPITDEKAVLDLLQQINLSAKKGDDGVYTIAKGDLIPVDVYFRFADNYAYVTARYKEAIARDKLLSPARVLPPEQVGTLSLSLRIDQIPKPLREIGLGEFERRVKDSGPPKGETEAQRRLELKARDEFVAQIASLFNDGEELTLRLNLDRKQKDLSFAVNLTARPGTKLATTITELGQSQSLFANLPARNSAFVLLAHVVLPESVRQALVPAIDEALTRGITEVKDPTAKAVAERFLKALAPSLKAGELDGEFDIRGPDNQHYTLVAGLKLRDAAGVEKALRDTVAQMPEEVRAKVQLDAEKLGDISVHRLDIMKEADSETRAALGDGPMYLAFLKDAAFATAGVNALGALKEALATKPGPGQPLRFELSMARIAVLLRDQKAAPQVAKQVFGQEPEGDKLRFTIEGGKALKVQFNMKTPLIRFFAELDRAEKGK